MRLKALPGACVRPYGPVPGFEVVGVAGVRGGPELASAINLDQFPGDRLFGVAGVLPPRLFAPTFRGTL